ncbi:MAG: SDR family oxidoreductase [Pirellulales bacterium]|nr:SDR family oxidoreductase [Pirellulales bacterium]
MSSHLLLTGATGLIGEYLLAGLLQKNVPLAVLTRAKDGDSPANRIEELLLRWEQTLGKPLPRPVVLAGETNRPGLGLSDEDLRWVTQHCNRILHNAASVQFQGSDHAQDPWLSNLTGTQCLLGMCAELGIRDLHYVSTAYVCGNRTGRIYEQELNCGQVLRNDYESSKFAAENLVRNAPFLGQRTIYRPGIVVGDSLTAYTSTYRGVYSYLQFTCAMARNADRDAQGRWHHPVRLNLTGQEFRSLVTVDYVADVILRVLESPASHGQTFHITPAEPTTSQEIETALARHCNYHGVEFVGRPPIPPASMNASEELFYSAVAAYQPYWEGDPVFDQTNTAQVMQGAACPRVDAAMLLRLFEFAARHNFGKRRR